MNERPGEKQIAIKMNEGYISRLDNLARRGHTNRRQLMVNFIKIWLDELKRSGVANFFQLAVILRGIEVEVNLHATGTREFWESNIPEKALPIILSKDDNLCIARFASRSSMSRHHMMKNMIVIGIEELEMITAFNEFQFSDAEPKLKESFGIIMAKGNIAFKKVKKVNRPLKSNRSKSIMFSSLGGLIKRRD